MEAEVVAAVVECTAMGWPEAVYRVGFALAIVAGVVGFVWAVTRKL